MHTTDYLLLSLAVIISIKELAFDINFPVSNSFPFDFSIFYVCDFKLLDTSPELSSISYNSFLHSPKRSFSYSCFTVYRVLMRISSLDYVFGPYYVLWAMMISSFF